MQPFVVVAAALLALPARALKTYKNASLELATLEQFYDRHLLPRVPAQLGAAAPVVGRAEIKATRAFLMDFFSCAS